MPALIRSAVRKIATQSKMFGAVCATLAFRTHKSRWRKVAFGGPPAWDKRNEFLTRCIPAGSSVLDLGCGAQTIRDHLAPGCAYQPCDLVQSTPDVIVCDFNAGSYPPVTTPYDYVVCSGVLEYMRKPGEFLTRISTFGQQCLLSYNPRLPAQTIVERMVNNWSNHYTQATLEGLFAEVGLQATLIHTFENGELLYTLSRRSSQVSGPRLSDHSTTVQQQHHDHKQVLRAILLGKPEARPDGDNVKLSANISENGVARELWFSLPAARADWFTTDRCDGFVVGLLLQAMARNKDIITEAPMSSRLWHNLSRFYIPMLAGAFPNLHPITIKPASLIDSRAKGQGVCAGFSGGVDSFASVVRHFVNESYPGHKITHFLFHNVGSHGHGTTAADRRLFNQRLKAVQPFPEEVGIPLIPVDSNLADIFPIDFIRMHPALNAAIPLVLQNQFQRYFYASTYKYADCGVGKTDDVARLDPFALHLFSTETLDCISTGCQLSRVDKTALVATYEPSHRYLNVCVDPAFKGRNCSVCFKCCRTMLTLELLGLDHLYRQVFDFEKFGKVRRQYLKKILFHKPASFEREIAELMLANGHGFWRNAMAVRRELDALFGRGW